MSRVLDPRQFPDKKKRGHDAFEAQAKESCPYGPIGRWSGEG